jgi:DDE domain
VVDVLLREQRDTESARAVLQQARRRTRTAPAQVITDHHQPYIKAEGFEALQAPRRGHVALEDLVPGYRPAAASPHAATRALVGALTALAARLPRRSRLAAA